MRRLLFACALSVLAYGAVFACGLDRPLTLGPLRAEMEAKLARGAALTGPKLVILAGSNGPYSHRCALLEPIVGRPCVNAGVAIGVGLDTIFARWTPLLHAGDAVYMPLELAQYARSRAATITGADAAMLWRHDWGTLARLAPDRWAAALFSTDLRGAAAAVAETAFAGMRIPDAVATNPQGDHTGHTRERAAAWQTTLAAYHPATFGAAQIAGGDGAGAVRAFVAAMRARGVSVIGGLPTGFDDVAPDAAAVAAIAALYAAEGGGFLALGNLSRYPRRAFYDTADHLNETYQCLHTGALAPLLRDRLAHARLADAQQRPLDQHVQ